VATFAVGDIHGHLGPLRELLAQITPELSAGDEVVFLGDYIDRGPDSRGCIDALLDFQARAPVTVTCLMGNHEQWLLETMSDHRRHAWLAAMDAMVTVQSYSTEAVAALVAAIGPSRRALYDETVALPYDAFFEAMPDAHRAFFGSLARVRVTPDAVCAHAGIVPGVAIDAQRPRTFVWGASGFPHDYEGPPTVVYGHHNDASVDGNGWPHPRLGAWTIGLDTIGFGVLTAMRLPDRTIWQSHRHATREELALLEDALWPPRGED
jgi:serine/threonine protein phosphatase 1